jgi:hypothetical protein
VWSKQAIELGWASLVDEFPVTDQGQPGLFGSAAEQPGGDPRDDDLWWPDCEPPDPDDAESGPEDDPDAWLTSLPPDIRAEVEARQPMTEAPWESAAAARAAFGDGGFCEAMPPGWMLARVVAEATLEGYAGLDDGQLSGVLRACHRQIAVGYAGLARAVSELAGRRAVQSRRPGWSGLGEHVADELAAELTLTGRSAARLLDVAHGLRRLPEVYEALLNGALDWARASLFVDELSPLDDAGAGRICEELAWRAEGWTTGQLRAALARAVLAADPGAAQRRKTAAGKDARVETWREPSGNAVLAGRELPAADVITADARLTADADWLRSNGADGTLPQLRAAAYLARLSGRDLAALLPPIPAGAADRSGSGGNIGGSGTGRSGSGGHSGSGDGHGSRGGGDGRGGGAGGGSDGASGGAGPGRRSAGAGSVHLTMPLAALAGLAELPGEVAGYGPADAATCRNLADWLGSDPATRWCLTLTGPDGAASAHACARRGPTGGQPPIRWAAGLRDRLQMLEHGTCRHLRAAAGYIPPAGLQHLIRVRQRRCSFPGCRRPAVHCDLDHTIPFEAGGLTCECNLASLCRRHHRAKQVPGWHLTQNQPGVMTWRLPSGRVYETVGDAYPS